MPKIECFGGASASAHRDSMSRFNQIPVLLPQVHFAADIAVALQACSLTGSIPLERPAVVPSSPGGCCTSIPGGKWSFHSSPIWAIEPGLTLVASAAACAAAHWNHRFMVPAERAAGRGPKGGAGSANTLAHTCNEETSPVLVGTLDRNKQS
jgi:hypothetical protein